jgi:hypothetical protein
MNKSTKLLLASVSPVALAAGWAMLDPAPAHATLTVVGQNVTFAAENFIGASASSTIIVGSTGLVVSSATNTSSDFAAGFVTFTLSNGATFSAVPSPVSVGLTLTSGSLVSGSTAVTYALSGGNTTVSSITLGSFSVTNVGTRLATSTNTINIAFSSIGSSTPPTTSAVIATSAQAYSFTGGAPGTVNIDLANGGSGLAFRATGGSNVTFASLGTLSEIGPANSNDISGANGFVTSASDTIRAIVNGNLSAFSSIYAATASCAATAPSGAVTGTIATDTRSATVSPLAVTSVYNICAIANGTTIIPAGTITGSASITFGARTVSGATYTPGAYSQSASTLSTLSYNGSTATAFYVVGAGSYTSAIRLSNTSTSAGSVFVQVTPDTTGVPVRALLDSTLAAGQSKFYRASDIRSAVGTSVLTDSGNRASVVFLTSFTGLQLQNFIVNPGGVLSGGTSVPSANTTGN